MDDEKRREIREINEKFAGEALRVMAGAYREFPADKQGIDESEVRRRILEARALVLPSFA